VEAAIAMRT